MIELVKGDLFLTDSKVIAFDVDCFGCFNCETSKEIKKKYPIVFEAYRQKYNTIGWSLGEIQAVKVNDDRLVVNSAVLKTSLKEGLNSCYLDYNALKNCMVSLLAFLKKYSFKQVSIPKIGSGLVGEEWTRVYTIIERVFLGSDVLLKIYSYVGGTKDANKHS